MNDAHLPAIIGIELVVLFVLGSHGYLIYTYATPPTKRFMQRLLGMGKALYFWIVAGLAAAYFGADLTVRLLALLARAGDKGIPFWLELSVQTFGFFSILAAVIPVILSTDRRYANGVTLFSVGLLALGNFCGNMFKYAVLNRETASWYAWSAIGFVTCSLVLVGLLGFAIFRWRTLRALVNQDASGGRPPVPEEWHVN